MTDREETTLDPTDWNELRALGHQMIDDMFEFLATVRERPVWQPVPPEVRARFQSPLPTDPSPAADVYREFKANVLPYPTGNIHPRFWGWVMGTGSPVAMLADLLASGMNAHLAGYDQSASLVEEQVLRWLSGLFGFPGTSSGVLTSSGTVANLIALTVARHVQAGFDIRRVGLQGDRDAPRLTVYCSSEAHSWSRKAVELLGLGADSLRLIPVDSDYRMVVPALRAAIDDDRARGMRPACVIGNAGTVNTGATDDLQAIAAICRRERIWFHVDGAFGAFAKLAPDYAHIVRGLELADSIAVDLHKWMYMPFEAGCVLIRDGTAHHDAFAITPKYLKSLSGGIAAQPLAFAARGLDLSRGFRALKIWFALKVHGASQFARLVAQNIEQAQYLARLITADPQLELVAPVALNIVCFRYRAVNADDARANEINEKTLVRLQESGAAVPSSTVLDGRFAIRVAITNHRSRREDFELLANLVTGIGRQIEEETRGPVRIRHWEPADTAALRRLVDDTLREYGFVFDAETSEADLNDIGSAYAGRGGAFYVLVDEGGAVIGSAGFHETADHTCKLRKMYVARTHRGRGLGRLLLNHVLEAAAARGFEHVILETSERMTEAIALYERAGFHRVEIQPVSPRCDTTYWLALHAQDAVEHG